MLKINDLEWALLILVVIGAINWGLVGIFRFDLVMVTFGTTPVLQNTVNVLIGIAGVYWFYKLVMMKK